MCSNIWAPLLWSSWWELSPQHKPDCSGPCLLPSLTSHAPLPRTAGSQTRTRLSYALNSGYSAGTRSSLGQACLRAWRFCPVLPKGAQTPPLSRAPSIQLGSAGPSSPEAVSGARGSASRIHRCSVRVCGTNRWPALGCLRAGRWNSPEDGSVLHPERREDAATALPVSAQRRRGTLIPPARGKQPGNLSSRLLYVIIHVCNVNSYFPVLSRS